MNPPFQPQKPRRHRFSAWAAAGLVALLVFPGLAGARLAQRFDLRLIAGYLAAVSILTFLLYWHDKRRAEANAWRTPESTLHLAEIFGGWPAAFLAQRALRHKISKTSYQAEFWVIVTLHQAVSIDFLYDWHYLRSALAWLHS